MSTAIVDSVMTLMTPQITTSLASRLGGSSATVRSGINTSVGALIGGIANQLENFGFIVRLFNMVRESNTNGILSNLPNLASGISTPLASEERSNLPSMLFGSQQTAIENEVGVLYGLGAFGGSELMSIAGPLAVAYLGQHIRDEGLNVFSFSYLIATESGEIEQRLPTPIRTIVIESTGPEHRASLTTLTPAGTVKKAIWLFSLLALALIAIDAVTLHLGSGWI